MKKHSMVKVKSKVYNGHDDVPVCVKLALQKKSVNLRKVIYFVLFLSNLFLLYINRCSLRVTALQ